MFLFIIILRHVSAAYAGHHQVQTHKIVKEVEVEVSPLQLKITIIKFEIYLQGCQATFPPQIVSTLALLLFDSLPKEFDPSGDCGIRQAEQ
jgi:hypothetical protein